MLNMINTKSNSTNITEKKEINDSRAVTIFRERLGQIRTNNNASQQSISNLLGVSRQTFAKYETRDTASLPDIEQLCRICDHFEVSPNYLLGYSDIFCDHKEKYGLSDKTINLLNKNPTIHQFFDYFVDKLVENDLEEKISQIGITNNVETVWERVFPKIINEAIDKAYDSMVEKATYSLCINSDELEKQLRIYFPKPASFADFFNKCLNQDGKNYILVDKQDFENLSDQEQYDYFIKTISSDFVEVKSIQYVYRSAHKIFSQKICDIIANYLERFSVNINE